MSFLDELVKKNIISRETASEVSEEASSSDKEIEEALLDREISSSEIFDIKKEYYTDIESREMVDKPVSPAILRYIPEKSAQHYKIVPIGVTEGEGARLEVGILDPDNVAAVSALQFISSNIGMPYDLYLISWDYYDHIMKNYSGAKGEVKKALGELDYQLQLEEEELAKDTGDVAGENYKEDAPITKIVNNILKFAAEKKASDVHIEPKENEMVVRYRIDGTMEKALTLPKKVQTSVIARVKIISNIKLDEKRVPQDGRFSGNFVGRKIDFRVSTFPTYYGEKVVMRLLESEVGARNVTDIGFTDKNLRTIRRALSKSFGIILICGPTGSGKTSTLYSFLNELDKDKDNILSLENPIELNVPGVSQSQMRPEIGYTFASGLRSVLRQDPDIIMVGEIRDKETAQLAIEAALTGHLVLSTIHTNTASDVVPRLIDMGVDPYLIGPTLVAAIGQRLARTFSGEPEAVEIDDITKAVVKKSIDDLPEKTKEKFLNAKNVYKAVPTEDRPSGMKGRIGVFEVMEVDKEIERIILDEPSSAKIYDALRSKGMVTLREDAMIKAFEGRIPFSEVLGL